MGKFRPEDLLSPQEKLWSQSYVFLLSRGYKLRPRYHPDWIPSWGLDSELPQGEPTEDSRGNRCKAALDATHVQTGQKVVIKRGNFIEASILKHLHSLKSDKDENRTVPVIDMFPTPIDDGKVFIVMPMLRIFSDLPFRRVGEFAEAMTQFLKGLAFLHRNNVAHRDACHFNLCMDASRMIPKGYHFAYENSHDGLNRNKFRWRTRSAVAPVQYYFIDFGLSSCYPPGQDPILETGSVGQDYTVPEWSWKGSYDPFKMDVCQLGNALKRVTQDYEGLEWTRPLLDAMTVRDPKSRPTAAEALKSFEELTAQFKKSDSKRRIWRRTLDPYFRFKIQYMGYNPTS